MAEEERAWTKGPWQVATNNNGLHTIVERAPGDRVCSAFFTGAIEGSAARAEHNAALIAAAPDLYESLRHAVEIIKAHVPREALGMNAQGDADVPGGFQQWPLLDEYLHYMTEALAKAEAPHGTPQATPESN